MSTTEPDGREKREAMAALRRLTRTAAEAQAKRDRTMLSFHERGLLQPKDLAEATGVTRARVHQVLQAERAKKVGAE